MRSSPMTGNNNNNNSASSETISCQDCGNKAKRDCEHRRCRTCCKTRGLPCPTHVKSTWVPVARRRQRQHHHHHQHHHHNLFNNLPLSLSTPTPFHHCLTTTSSSGQEGNFPAEVNSLATFKCIRVSSDDNVVEQYAYQTSINIGGHMFKGILYDQGTTTTAGTTSGGGGDQSSSAGTSDYPHHHQFSITAATTAAAQTGDGGGGANVLYPPHPLYSTPFNAFLPGMQFFPHPRP